MKSNGKEKTRRTQNETRTENVRHRNAGAGQLRSFQLKIPKNLGAFLTSLCSLARAPAFLSSSSALHSKRCTTFRSDIGQSLDYNIFCFFLFSAAPGRFESLFRPLPSLEIRVLSPPFDRLSGERNF